MQEQDRRWASRIREALSRLDELEPRLAANRGPLVGSRAAADAARRFGGLGWSEASAALAVSFDHLRAWRHLHTSGMQPPFAHCTLLRSAVEAAATARWICEPRQDAAARGVGAMLYELDNRSGFEARVRKTMPSAPPWDVPATAWIETIGREAGVSQRLPGPTELARRFLPPATLADETVDSEVLYRALSAIAHAKTWAMPILGESVRGEPVEQAPELAGSLVSAADDVVWLLTDWAIGCLTDALADFEAYSVG